MHPFWLPGTDDQVDATYVALGRAALAELDAARRRADTVRARRLAHILRAYARTARS